MPINSSFSGSRYRKGYAPLPPQDSELLLSLNEDADWVMGTLANIGGGTGRRKHPPLLVEGRELILGDWVEEMAASVVGVHRAPAFLRHCFVEQPYLLHYTALFLARSLARSLPPSFSLRHSSNGHLI